MLSTYSTVLIIVSRTHRMPNQRLSRRSNQWSGVAHLKRLAVDVTAADAAANNAIAVISALQACSCPTLPIHSFIRAGLSPLAGAYLWQ